MKCKFCGKEIDDGSAFCGYCGKKQPQIRCCVKCGQEIGLDDKWCGYCGTEQPSQDGDSNSPIKVSEAEPETQQETETVPPVANDAKSDKKQSKSTDGREKPHRKDKPKTSKWKWLVAGLVALVFVIIACAIYHFIPKPVQTLSFTVNGVSFDMVKVEAGTFTMGATPEMENPKIGDETVHKVTLTNDYYIGKYEVTQALWKAVMGSNPSYFQGDNLPVERVDWDDCQVFIKKLDSITNMNFRLPTEAEWEYAARGGNKSKSSQFSGGNDLENVAWYRYNSDETTHPVGTRQPNELGIYDMSGNVWEWCQDWYCEYIYTTPTNPKGRLVGGTKASESKHVYRGGSFENSAELCRISLRNFCWPEPRSNDLGFRLCLSK